MVATQFFFGIFTPKLGEDEPILTSIFFRCVGSTTNYRKSVKSCLFFCDARIPCRTWIRKVVPTLETHRNADAFVHVFCFI